MKISITDFRRNMSKLLKSINDEEGHLSLRNHGKCSHVVISLIRFRKIRKLERKENEKYN